MKEKQKININVYVATCYIISAPFFDEILENGLEMNNPNSYMRTVKGTAENPEHSLLDILLWEEKWFLRRKN